MYRQCVYCWCGASMCVNGIMTSDCLVSKLQVGGDVLLV